MSRKSKGINAERELIHLFWGNGWSACRVAGSGSIKYPCPDVIAGNNIRKLAIECKATRDRKQYLTKKEVDELREFGRIFGAEPWIGVRFNNMEWYFLTLDDLADTEENHVVTIENAKTKGFLFEEMIKKQ
ncbi:Holliday junction resolvase [archaeon]|nr:Holliday junction resolvase [archaeon]